MGRHEGTLKNVQRVSGTSEQVQVEFKFEKLYSDFAKPEIYYLTASIDPKELFGQPEHRVKGWRLTRGGLPNDAPASECYQLINSSIHSCEIRNTCADSPVQTKLLFGSYIDKSMWRPFALPVALPVAVVTDIAMSPLYAGWYIKCSITKNCK